MSVEFGLLALALGCVERTREDPPATVDPPGERQTSPATQVRPTSDWPAVRFIEQRFMARPRAEDSDPTTFSQERYFVVDLTTKDGEVYEGFIGTTLLSDIALFSDPLEYSLAVSGQGWSLRASSLDNDPCAGRTSTLLLREGTFAVTHCGQEFLVVPWEGVEAWRESWARTLLARRMADLLAFDLGGMRFERCALLAVDCDLGKVGIYCVSPGHAEAIWREGDKIRRRSLSGELDSEGAPTEAVGRCGEVGFAPSLLPVGDAPESKPVGWERELFSE